jgi:hypothetical protein
MNENATITHGTATAASSTYRYARLDNPRTLMQVSGRNDNTIQHEALDCCNHKHPIAEAALNCLGTLDSCGYFYPIHDAEGRRPVGLCAIEVSHG